ncbi:MAG: hypothetical protein LBH62_06175 [Nitrososphaerota archaeon]|jgi:hypothetical protein|nr:hypothetical protein [Nitrososphaerota archaeon]
MFFTSLLFALTLLFSPIASTFNGFLHSAYGAEPIHVGTQTELRFAVDNAATAEPTIIALTADITLTNSALNIPKGKDITLTSIGAGENFWKLVGAPDQDTITVDGKLTLETAKTLQNNIPTITIVNMPMIFLFFVNMFLSPLLLVAKYVGPVLVL